MRDQHRPKEDLVNEVVALRKQVADLKDAMGARRRVEDALGHSEEQLRALVDGSPVGLCLFRPDGAPVAANRPFARMLGYDSPAELLSVGEVLGVFAGREQQARVLALVERAEERVAGVIFRCKDGDPQAFWAIGAACSEPDAIVLVVLEREPPLLPAPSLAALSAASSGGTRSA